MKKRILVPILSLVAIIAVGGTLVAAANKAKPGDPLYTLDRTSEAAILSIEKVVSKLSYGKYNLKLASERIQEMKDLRKSVSASLPLIQRVSAQSTDVQKLNEFIALLLADVAKNLSEAQSTLDALPDAQKEKLSLEIADRTTEFGNGLLEITKDLSTENTKKLTEIIDDIDIIDSSAVGFLTDLPDEDPDVETEEEDHVSSTLQSKLERKLLKLREALRIYTERKETNKATLSAENIAKAEVLIAEINLDLGTAETQLGTQNYKTVDDILDRADDKIDTLKDIVKVDGDEDAGSNDSGDDSNDDSGDDSGDDSKDDQNDDSGNDSGDDSKDDSNEDEDTNDDSGDDDNKPQTTGTPKPSKTPEPSEKPEETEKPEPTEKPEDEEDVNGTQTQPSSLYDILRNRLRF